MWTAPGKEGFKAYMAKIPVVEKEDNRTFISHIIPDDDEKCSMQPPDLAQTPTEEIRDHHDDSVVNEMVQVNIDLKTFRVQHLRDLHMIPDNETPMALSDHDELIQWHHELDHLLLDPKRANDQSHTTAL